MRFRDIRQIPNPHYNVHVPWNYFQENLDRWEESFDLQLDPEFQRDHVWTEWQQRAYLEFILRDGQSGRDIYFNAKNWDDSHDGTMTLVDGKQRVTAVQLFLNNEIIAYGGYYSDFKDRLPFHAGFTVHVNNLSSKGVLEWYLNLNSGIAHTNEELEKVRKMIEEKEQCVEN